MIKKDLIQLLSHGRVKFLRFGCLNELDEEFFQCFFSAPASRQSGFKLMHESIETMEFKEMNSIGADLVVTYLFNNSNSLKDLAFLGCKLISKYDASKMRLICKEKNLDCAIKWS